MLISANFYKLLISIFEKLSCIKNTCLVYCVKKYLRKSGRCVKRIMYC